MDLVQEHWDLSSNPSVSRAVWGRFLHIIDARRKGLEQLSLHIFRNTLFHRIIIACTKEILNWTTKSCQLHTTIPGFEFAGLTHLLRLFRLFRWLCCLPYPLLEATLTRHRQVCTTKGSSPRANPELWGPKPDTIGLPLRASRDTSRSSEARNDAMTPSSSYPPPRSALQLSPTPPSPLPSPPWPKSHRAPAPPSHPHSRPPTTKMAPDGAACCQD